jgi:hypothetical protein
MRLIVPAFAALGLSACAGTPPASSTTAAAPAPAAVQAAATDKPVGTEDSENPFPGTQIRKGPGGQTLYCRKDEVAGTRIPQLVCATEDVMRSRGTEGWRAIDDARTNAGLGGCNPSAGC